MIVSVWLLILLRREVFHLFKVSGARIPYLWGALAGRMGSCMCKEKTSTGREVGRVVTQQNVIGGHDSIDTGHPTHQVTNRTQHSSVVSSVSSLQSGYSRSLRRNVNVLVEETLNLIRTLIDNEQEPPQAMIQLHKIAETEEGWMDVAKSLILSIPLDDPLGPAVITLLLDECPLPAKEAIAELRETLCLSKSGPNKLFSECSSQRNICVLLGCLAEKLAGPNSLALLTHEVLEYLVTNLSVHNPPVIILHSLVALEKFAQTSENKATITRALQMSNPRPLEKLETWWHNDDFLRREVGFCSQWCLDNLCKVDSIPI
ncbi:hypothetical protein CHS0354_033904 [Potamilus streckersoni]|uniref:RING-type E3 ubiquitin transferase n=1 Tax=Potamilus streckersoni TaxID=2493646 RepID=A0AAE0RWS7_9BIVA|nr:hypothetical protein CHS0354_033904 [Potamilus streckersoni]